MSEAYELPKNLISCTSPTQSLEGLYSPQPRWNAADLRPVPSVRVIDSDSLNSTSMAPIILLLFMVNQKKKSRRGQTPAVFYPQSPSSNLIKPLLHELLNVGLFSVNTNQRERGREGGRAAKFSISVMTAEVETVSKQDPFKCVSESQGQHFDIWSARKASEALL